MTPNEFFDDYQYMVGLYKGQMKYNRKVNESFDLKPGDKVRAMVGKGTFEKEKARFSQEIYIVQEQIGYKFKIADSDTGKTLKRKYRSSELIRIDEVRERIGKNKQTADKEHKKINRTRKALDTSYDEAVVAIGARDQPKEKRIRKKVTKLDL